MQTNKLLFACLLSVSMFSTSCFSMQSAAGKDDAQNEVDEEKISSQDKISLNEELIEATVDGDAELVTKLLAQGANANYKKRPSGATALHYFLGRFKGIKSGYNTTKIKLMICLLVKTGGANVNAVDACKRTPYWLARFFELGDDIYKTLEELGACTINSPEMQ